MRKNRPQLGKVLIQRLMKLARAFGFNTLTSELLVADHDAITLCRNLGFTLKTLLDDGFVEGHDRSLKFPGPASNLSGALSLRPIFSTGTPSFASLGNDPIFSDHGVGAGKSVALALNLISYLGTTQSMSWISVSITAKTAPIRRDAQKIGPRFVFDHFPIPAGSFHVR